MWNFEKEAQMVGYEYMFLQLDYKDTYRNYILGVFMQKNKACENEAFLWRNQHFADYLSFQEAWWFDGE